MARSVAFVTLGCARNEVDSEELAGRLTDDGWRLATDTGSADAVVVNTCGFIAAAKRDSVDALFEAADSGRPVVAVGCMAERYGVELARELPEAAAVLSFDDYPELSARLHDVLAGRPLPAHRPVDRRTLLPIAPVDRRSHAAAAGRRPPRRRLARGPVAAVKLSSGCDRRCAFCAIPRFRGAHLSRPPEQVLDEVEWLADRGVREVLLVSENSTSYGKDLGDLRLLERLLPELARVPGVARVRVSYLQPAELRPGLVEVLATTPGVAPYFDLSFQHASGPVLARMRRFGDAERFLTLLAGIRAVNPDAGIRSNMIVGLPGETRADVELLCEFLRRARLDAVGVFGYSDEEGTEAATMPGKVRADVRRRRRSKVAALAEHLVAERAEERIGETVTVLVESAGRGRAEGRAAHQAPEVDGNTRLLAAGGGRLRAGDLVTARVVQAAGADLVAVPVGAAATAGER